MIYFFIFASGCMCVCVCVVYVKNCFHTQGDQKEVTDTLEPKLQSVVNCSTWELEIELMSSEKIINN